MTEAELKDMMKRLVVQYGSQRKAAAHLGITQAYLCDILRGRRHGDSQKILEKLGLKKTVNYENI